MWRLRAPLLALLLMQVILLASSGVTATKKPLGKQETCNMKNHMIEYLRNNGVQIYERPQISSEACKSEWSEFGACCAHSSLTIFLQKKFLNNQLALELQIQSIKIVSEKLEAFRDKYLVKETAAKSLWALGSEHQTSDFNSSVSNSTVAQGTESLPITDKLDQILTKLESEQTQRIQNQEKCVSKINKVTATIACPICSGRSDDFFDGTFKNLKISSSLLYGVLADCYPAWTSLEEFQKDVHNYTDLVLSTSSYSCGRGTKCWEGDAITMTISSFMTKRNLIPILSRCNPNSLATCEYKHVAALCEQFIHIQDSGYAAKIEEEAASVINAVNSTQMAVTRAQQRYQTYNETLQNEGMMMSQAPIKIRLRQIQDAFQNMTYITEAHQTRWNQLHQFRAQVISLSRLSADLAKQLRQTDVRLTLLQFEIEEFLAQHHLAKWKKLRSLLSELTLANMSSSFTTELSYLWNKDTAVIEGWAQRNCTQQESQMLADLNAKAFERFHLFLKCLNKRELIETRSLWNRVISKVQLILKRKRTRSEIQTQSSALFSPFPIGEITLPNKCIVGFKGSYLFASSANSIESSGFVKDPQCNPCVTDHSDNDNQQSKGSP